MNFLFSLPEDIVGEIYSFIPITSLYTLNKPLFIKYYPVITQKYTINDKVFQNYIRNLIRNDCDFKLRILLRNNLSKWIKPLNWKYKHDTYPSYLVFLKLLCYEYNSQRSKNLINSILNTRQSKKNKHKKIRCKNIKWSN